MGNRKTQVAIVGIASLLLLTTSCLSAYRRNVQQQHGQPPVDKRYFPALYNPSESILHPQYRVYAENDTLLHLFYSVAMSEVRQTATNAVGSELPLFLAYTLRAGTQVVDSGSLINRVDLTDIATTVSGSIDLHTTARSNHTLTVVMYGKSEKSRKRSQLNFSTDNAFAPPFFVVTNVTNGDKLLFDDIVNPTDTFCIGSVTHQHSVLHVDFYPPDDYVPFPPYFISDPQTTTRLPDTSFDYVVGTEIVFPQKGFYCLRGDTTDCVSMCLLNCGDDFPQVHTLGSMLEPLKLLTTYKEYKRIASSGDLKYAIDNYWLSRSRSAKLAKDQIRIFYNRVALANRYFSDHRAGWQTDRGNIYVMLGPPNYVFVTAEGEEWHYGENPQVASVFFSFRKAKGHFGNDDLIMERNLSYQAFWGQVLATWNSGRIFTFSK